MSFGSRSYCWAISVGEVSAGWALPFRIASAEVGVLSVIFAPGGGEEVLCLLYGRLEGDGQFEVHGRSSVRQDFALASSPRAIADEAEGHVCLLTILHTPLTQDINNFSGASRIFTIPMASTIFLPFLRPLPLPRFLLHGFSRRISTHPHLQEGGKVPLPLSFVDLLTQNPQANAVKVAPAIQNSLPPLPYHVHRTASQQLPIYHLAKRGGNLHQTRIRKIDGNLMELKKDLRQALGLKEEQIAINSLTKHIIIKVRQGLRGISVTMVER